MTTDAEVIAALNAYDPRFPGTKLADFQEDHSSYARWPRLLPPTHAAPVYGGVGQYRPWKLCQVAFIPYQMEG